MSNLEPMPDTGKAATDSTAVWGAVTALGGLVLPPLAAKLGLTPADLQHGLEAVGQIVVAAGVLLGLWGRIRASAPITSIFRK